jgi:hypothetical protein
VPADDDGWTDGSAGTLGLPASLGLADAGALGDGPEPAQAASVMSAAHNSATRGLVTELMVRMGLSLGCS